MKKILKLTFISFLIIITFCMINKVKAATTQLSTNSSSITEGDTVTVKVTINAAQWNLTLTANGETLDTWTETVNYKENLSKTFSVSYKATEKGTVKFVLTGDITDVDQTNTEINTNKTVTVKEKETTDTSSEESTTKTPKFTAVNETVYATTEVNVRKSYSTSSAIVGSLEKGESVKRTGIGDNGWSKVTYNGQTAYISSTYLTKTKPVVEEPKEEPEDTNITANENNENNEINTNTNNTDNNNTTDNETQNNSQNLQLSKLEISGVNFSEGFNPEIYTYELKLNFFVKDLNITAVANKEDAKIEIIGNEDFKEGENNINILVSSADGNETVTYQIKVIVPSEVENNPQNNLQFYLICGIIILAAIAAIIVVIAIYKQKNKREYDDDTEEDFYKFKIDEQYDSEEKPKRTKGKHSN